MKFVKKISYLCLILIIITTLPVRGMELPDRNNRDLQEGSTQYILPSDVWCHIFDQMLLRNKSDFKVYFKLKGVCKDFWKYAESRTHLDDIDMFSCQIKDEIFKFFPHLRSLNLKYNRNVTDAGIMLLTNLTSLNIAGSCEGGNITNGGLAKLTNLTHLDLSYNKLITNDALTSLTKITQLSLKSNQLITDDGIYRLTNMLDLI